MPMPARSRLGLAAFPLLLAGSIAGLMPEPPTGLAKGSAGNLPAAPVRAGAGIQFKSPVCDFGRVAAGSVVPCLFQFSNAGDETLLIRDVTTSCGCTSLGDWDRVVAPGQSGSLLVQFATSNFNGTVYKPVWVASNAAGQSNTLLHITGTVWLPVECIPAVAGFGVLGSRTAHTNQLVRIVSNLPEPIALDAPVSSSPCFRARLQTAAPGREFLLEVATVPPLSNGVNSAVISLKTSSAQLPVLTVPVRAIVQPILIVPPQMFLMRNTNGEPATLSAAIINQAEQSLILSDPRINLEGVGVQLCELLAGRRYRVGLTFPAGVRLPAARQVALRLRTNHPDFPAIELPVLAPTIRD